MKTQLLLTFLFALPIFANAQTVTIPNSNFKNYLLAHPGINTNGDNQIQVSEAEAFSDSIQVYGLEISNFTGLEAFINLKYFACVNNGATVLNLSQNTQLEGLVCAMNNISSLDISANVNLKNIRCAQNPIQSLNVSNQPLLEYLYVENMQLTVLDVSENPLLKELNCNTNQLTSLDLSENTLLQKLNSGGNPISSLNIENCNELTHIYTNGNPVGSLNLTEKTLLKELTAVNCNLSFLDLSGCVLLERLDCPFNVLTALNLSNNPALKVVYVFSNQLTAFNIANGANEELAILWTANNPINCFMVDDVQFSNANWTGNNFQFDSAHVFVTECLLSLNKPEIHAEIFPNPASDQICVSMRESVNNFEFYVTDLNGKHLNCPILHVKDQTLIDVSSLNPAVYLVYVVEKDFAKVNKILRLVKE